LRKSKPYIFKLLGPLAFVLFQYIKPPGGLNPVAFMLLGITVWMAIWWVFEVVPIAVTANYIISDFQHTYYL
jgi:sodium-dependent dicarboxylate transporter 2/3/5